MSKLAVAPVTGSGSIEISMDVYYDPATLNTSAYHNFINGRGNNTGFHSGMMIPGVLNENAFEGRWRLQSTGSTISKTGLTADWYRYSMIITEKTFQIKLLNLRTNVLLSGSVANIGTVDNGDSYAFTLLCYGITGTTGAYGTIGVNISNAKITRNGVTLVNIPFSAGAGTQVINVYNGSTLDLAFFTAATGWAKLSDYCHYNFVKGYTLYQKSGSADIRIPNKFDGTETTYTPPTGYTKTKNYGSSLLAFNQCESKFKLDDVSAGEQVLTVANAGTTTVNGNYTANGIYNGKTLWTNGAVNIRYQGSSEWYVISTGGTLYYYGYGTSPELVPTWFRSGGATPVPTITSGTTTPDALYTADPDHYLFTESTGVAKEFSIAGIDFNYDRGYLYINSDVQETNFMLYKADKTLTNDLKVLKYVEQIDRVSYDEETGLPNYDENNHAELTE